MIFSFSDFAQDKLRNYDICIVGAGPAGLTVALELLYKGLKVCVLPGSHWKEDRFHRDLKRAEFTNLKIRNDSRTRAFGGTSAIWAGKLAVLDSIDLEARESIHPAWPQVEQISEAINELGYRYDLPEASLFDLTDANRSRLPQFKDLAPKVFLTQNRPFDFGRRFKHAFMRDDLDLIVGATATVLNSVSGGGIETISSVTANSSSGATVKVKAKFFVLAAGCLENIRLLWNSNDIGGTSLGNQNDQLGRGYMNHPKGIVGDVIFNKPLKFDDQMFKFPLQNYRGYIGLRLTEPQQRHSGLLNCYLRMVRPTAFQHNWFGQSASKALTKLLSSHPYFTYVRSTHVMCHMEMEALGENRVSLSTSSVDSNDVPLPVVNFDISEKFAYSVERLLQKFSDELASLGIGTFVRRDLPIRKIFKWDASHHLGGTALGKEPQTSVVSPELKVHGTKNLFVTGGSVFPSSGNANPTLTIVGQSINLAKTLIGETGASARREKPHGKSDNGVIIIGAGRRVSEDIVPAIEAHQNAMHIAGIYATKRGVVFGSRAPLEVQPMDALDQSRLESAKTVYVAVATKSTNKVLANLLNFNCKHIRLIIDTPAIRSRLTSGLSAHFRSVHVAEDSILIPWISVLHSYLKENAEVSEIVFKNSGFKWHAIALSKAILSRTDFGRDNNPVSFGFRIGKRKRIKFQSGNWIKIINPKNYEVGKINIFLKNGKKVSSHSDSDTLIHAILEDHKCIGFSVGNFSCSLTPPEVALVGRFSSSDSVVSRMLDLKRVGLYRLLRAIMSDEPNYGFAEGVEASQVSRNLEKWCVYHPMALKRV